MLHLLLLTAFSNRELLCMDPASIMYISYAAIATAAATVAVPVIDNIGSGINNTCRYYFPTAIDKAIATAAEVEEAESRKKLDYLDKATEYKNCLENSNPESPQTIHGVPVDCKKIMVAFILCGGESENEVIAMTALYNKYKG